MIDRTYLGIKKQKQQLRRQLKLMQMSKNDIMCVVNEFGRSLVLFPVQTPENLRAGRVFAYNDLLYRVCNGDNKLAKKMLGIVSQYLILLSDKLPWFAEMWENTQFMCSSITVEKLYQLYMQNIECMDYESHL